MLIFWKILEEGRRDGFFSFFSVNLLYIYIFFYTKHFIAGQKNGLERLLDFKEKTFYGRSSLTRSLPPSPWRSYGGWTGCTHTDTQTDRTKNRLKVWIGPVGRFSENPAHHSTSQGERIVATTPKNPRVQQEQGPTRHWIMAHQILSMPTAITSCHNVLHACLILSTGQCRHVCSHLFVRYQSFTHWMEECPIFDM